MAEMRPETVVYIDEVGIRMKTLHRTRGRAHKSRKAIVRRSACLQGDGGFTGICALDLYGFCAVSLTPDNVTADMFTSFLRQSLVRVLALGSVVLDSPIVSQVPLLGNFDRNEPNSVVVMDNARVHDVDAIRDIIEGVGAMLVMLPPYSPDLNPIECTCVATCDCS